MLCSTKAIAIVLFCALSFVSAEVFERTIRFANSRPSALDEKRCTLIPVNDELLYITALTPHANRKNAHHMVLIGCKHRARTPSLDHEGNSWRCDDEGDNSCGVDETGDHQKVFFTWALNAEGFTFPPNVGYRIGRKANVNYLVLQVHYAKAIHEGDDSALTVTLTNRPLPFQAATYILGGDGFVPPRVREFHLETACKLNLPYEITPLAYRTHSHHLGDVISGYVIRNNEWTELGRMSPRQPEQYYMATNQDLILNNGDVLAGRCTMNSLARDEKTWMGHRNIDEMCVFYLLYYTEYQGEIEDTLCFHNANRWSWATGLGQLGVTSKAPKDASSLAGVNLIRPINELEREELTHLGFPTSYFYDPLYDAKS